MLQMNLRLTMPCVEDTAILMCSVTYYYYYYYYYYYAVA